MNVHCGEVGLKVKVLYLWGRDRKQSWPKVLYQYLRSLIPLGEGRKVQHVGLPDLAVKFEFHTNNK